MKVLIAPDKFKGTIPATEVAQSIAEAIDNSHEVIIQPLADGGEGTLEIFGGGNKISVVAGPLGEPVKASWRLEGKSAVIEMAQASGLHLIQDKEQHLHNRRFLLGVLEMVITIRVLNPL